MKFSNIISAAILFFSPILISAAPTVHQLQRRECRSVATIQQWIRDNANVGENTIFYTAGATQRQAEFLAPTLTPEGQYWGKVYPQNTVLDWLDECGVGPVQDDLFPRMGEALARESTGTAYVLMPPGGRPIAAFWRDNEYPYLNGNGVRIIAVNAENLDDRRDYVHPNNPF